MESQIVVGATQVGVKAGNMHLEAEDALFGEVKPKSTIVSGAIEGEERRKGGCGA